MHSGSPGSGRTAHGVPDANDTITDVATGQRLFIIVPHRTSVSGQLVMITPLKVIAFAKLTASETHRLDRAIVALSVDPELGTEVHRRHHPISGHSERGQ
jgi:hypothetical protein